MSCINDAKRFIAGFLASLMLGLPAFSDITGMPGNIGNIETNGNITNITGGFVNGNNTINHFQDFGINNNQTVNQYFSTGNAINLVKNHIDINGVYNAFGNGSMNNIGGNVMFISPLGMAVGAGGMLNVGSMQMIVPTQAVYNNMAAAFENITKAYENTPAGSNYEIQISNDLAGAFTNHLTSIKAPENLSTDQKVTINGQISASGLVEIAASSIELTSQAVDKSNINTLGEVNLIANTGDIVGSSNLNISSDGKITLTANKGNIKNITTSLKSADSGKSLNISAAADNGSISVESNSNTIFENVSANGTIDLKTSGSGKLTANNVVSNTQNIVLTSAGDIDAQTIKSAANIEIIANGAFNQLSSGIIESTKGDILISGITDSTLGTISSDGKFSLTSTGTVLLNNIIKGSSVSLNSAAISGSGSIDSGNISLISSENIGSQNQSLNITNSNGDINISATATDSDVFITADKNTSISSLSGNNINFSSDESLTVGNINAKGNLSLSAQNNLLQNDGTTISNTGSASLVSTSGNINISNINSDNSISASANAGNIDINSTKHNAAFNNITAGKTINLTTSDSGNITANNISSSASSVSINSAQNAILNNISGSGVDINATGSVSQSGSSVSVTSTKDISITAGSIGTESQALLLKADSGKVNLTSNNGNIYIGSKGNNTLTLGAINAGNNTFSFVGDNLTNLVTTNNIVASILNFSNLNDINVNNDFGTADVLFENIKSATITKLATSGDIRLNNISNISAQNGTISGNRLTVSGFNSANFGATAINGDINIYASSSDITLSGTMQGNNISLTGKDILAATNGMIDASGNISLNASGKIGNDTSSLNVTNSQGTKVNITDAKANSNIHISAQKDAEFNNISGSNITLTSESSLNTGNITASGNLILDAVGNITQITSTLIDAAGTTNLSSTSGNITISNINSDNSISAIANNGNINLSSTNHNASFDNISANGSINLNTIGSGDITANNVTSKTSSVTVNSVQNINVNKISAANGVDLDAGTNIILNSDSNQYAIDAGTGNADLTAKNITQTGNEIAINADSGINLSSESIGSQSQALLLKSDSGKVNATSSNGDIRIGSKGNNTLTLGSINAGDNTFAFIGDGLANMTTTNDITAGTLNFSNLNDITINNDFGTTDVLFENIKSATITKLATSGDITLNNISNIAAQNGTISGSSLNVSGFDSANFGSADITGDINIASSSSGGDITLSGTMKGSNVTISGGNILTASSGVIDSTGNISLTANGSIGSNGAAVTLTNTAGDKVNVINARAGSGKDIYLKSQKNADFNNINGNNVSLSSDDTLNTGNITASGVLNINAKNNIQQIADTTIKTTGTTVDFVSQSGLINISNINSTSEISANANTSIDIASTGTNLNIKNLENKTGNITISSSGNGNISFTENAIANAANDMILNSNNNLTLNGLLSANNKLTASTKNNLIAGGTISAADVSLNGGSLDSTGLTTINNANIVALTANTGKIGNNGTFNIKTNANITANGKTGIDITSQSNNLNITTAESSGNIRLNTNGTGNILAENVLSTAGTVGINSAESAEITNITAQNDINITTNSGLTHSGLLDTDGNLIINNNNSGNVILNNLDINTAKSGTITNNADSQIIVNGTISNNGTLTFTAASNTTNSGINFANTSNLNNAGIVNIENNGALGATLAGTIDNSLQNAQFTLTNNNGNITIPQTNNDFSGIYINNSGKMTMTNNGSGKIDLKGAVKNNKTGNLTLSNNADGGLNFDENAIIDNYGTLSLVNSNGAFTLDGTLNMQNNSINSFTDSSENDLILGFKDLKNFGNNVTFQKEGHGRLIVDDNAKISNYKVGNNGTISLINTAENGVNGGGIVIKETAQLVNGGTVDGTAYEGGIFNIANSGTGSLSGNGIDINGEIANNGELNITNNTGNININSSITGNNASETVNIKNSGNNIVLTAQGEIADTQNVLIQNLKDSTGSIEISGKLTNDTNVTLSNLNEQNTGVHINVNRIDTTGLLTIENNGQEGINIAKNQTLSSKGGIKLINNNKGTNGITIAGLLENNENIPAEETAKNPQAGHGIKIYNNQSTPATQNDGITITGTINSNAGVNEIINYVTAENSKLSLTGNINTYSGITLENYSSGGLDLQGTITNTINPADSNLKGDIALIVHNSNLEIEHKLNPDDVYLNNKNGGVRLEVKGQGNILHTGEADGVGIVSTGNIYLNTQQGNVGERDDVIDTARENGFENRLDNSKSINVITENGTINANAKNNGNATVNIRTLDRDFTVGNIASDNTVLVTAVDGSIVSGQNSGIIQAKDAYLYAGGNDSAITINNAVINGKLSGETDGNINITSANSGQKMDVDYLFSKNGSINLNINGNSYIDAITAPEAINVTSHGSHLKFNNLGKFEADRAADIHPDDLNLTVTSHNGLLEILNAYVRENVVMKADRIYANEHDTTATGFHSANQNGEMVVFDIQGYNNNQEVIHPPLPEWINPNYVPQNDKKVLDLKLTIGKPVYEDTLFGAQFDKVYSDVANINATEILNDLNEKIPANFNFDSMTVNKHGRIENNKYIIDVNNDTFKYDYQAAGTLFTKITGSFWLKMNENPEIQTCAPIIYYNNSNILNSPQTENSFQRLTHKSNKIEEDTTLDSFRDRHKNTRSYKDRHDIRWSLLSSDYKILSSSTESGHSVIDIRDISKGGMLVATDGMLKNGELISVNFLYKGIPFDVKGEVVRANSDLTAGVQFKEVDRFTSNLILYITMMSENL